MQIKKAEIRKIFKKLNLDVRSTKHQYGWFIYENKKILRVHYSHGKGDVPGRVSDKIRNQLKVTEREFRELVNCPLSLKEYISILRGKGLIE